MRARRGRGDRRHRAGATRADVLRPDPERDERLDDPPRAKNRTSARLDDQPMIRATPSGRATSRPGRGRLPRGGRPARQPTQRQADGDAREHQGGLSPASWSTPTPTSTAVVGSVGGGGNGAGGGPSDTAVAVVGPRLASPPSPVRRSSLEGGRGAGSEPRSPAPSVRTSWAQVSLRMRRLLPLPLIGGITPLRPGRPGARPS